MGVPQTTPGWSAEHGGNRSILRFHGLVCWRVMRQIPFLIQILFPRHFIGILTDQLGVFQGSIQVNIPVPLVVCGDLCPLSAADFGAQVQRHHS